MDNCIDCNPEPIPLYRVVQTIEERNSIPCKWRKNGMIVTVVGLDNSYKQFMLQGGDPCVNANWQTYGLSPKDLVKFLGGDTIFEEPEGKVTDRYLNERYPEALQGFRVTFKTLNTTFMKTYGDKWVLTNDIANE